MQLPGAHGRPLGQYYARCRDHSWSHGEVKKAVARKRLKAIYAVMRGKVSYIA